MVVLGLNLSWGAHLYYASAQAADKDAVYENLEIFTKALQRLLPELTEDDILPGGSGVRAPALDASGKLLDDFCFVHQDRMLHVCNVPSPAATASLVIGREIVAAVEQVGTIPANHARKG